MSPRACLILGSLLAGLAVAAGTFGAHGLPAFLEQRHALTQAASPADFAKAIANFETAARYQMYHAMALLFVGLWSERRPSKSLSVAGAAFLFGSLVFSGFLYALVLTQQKWLGAIVPIGGVSFLVGWIATLIAAINSSMAPSSAHPQRGA
jgi:uncharacterized membrane protein YgdD (TMEM256/DUF423 family)